VTKKQTDAAAWPSVLLACLLWVLAAAAWWCDLDIALAGGLTLRLHAVVGNATLLISVAAIVWTAAIYRNSRGPRLKPGERVISEERLADMIAAMKVGLQADDELAARDCA
jgi:hypothetical protein